MNRVYCEIKKFIPKIISALLENTPDELKDFVSNNMNVIWNEDNVRVHIPCLSWDPIFGILDVVVTKEEILKHPYHWEGIILHKYSQMLYSLPEHMYITRKRK